MVEERQLGSSSSNCKRGLDNFYVGLVHLDVLPVITLVMYLLLLPLRPNVPLCRANKEPICYSTCIRLYGSPCLPIMQGDSSTLRALLWSQHSYYLLSEQQPLRKALL